ncbi:c6 zinc finger domain containing protein [Sporothrix schenckii 1099-18]|uniref:C6 zinc finger domain containing protein n=1 Tax=Sporothrix schenckii 1099-18 TaxID=1397361 RepID=A0A0F2MD66_SPOSC|nr:c6 zinc finger domain containing protein [Sporothrix schenckii 1099-18]KJR87587.1 c6 zinc finger domain containing protein [Sporothrix schenckii 1099-18]
MAIVPVHLLLILLRLCVPVMCARTSTGRVCDGFDPLPSDHSNSNGASNGRFVAVAHRPTGRMSMSALSPAPSPSLSTHRISPSSYGDPLEARSLLYFTERTIAQFQAFFPDEFWNSHVLQFALSQDCIRHAIVSLSAHHERYSRPHADGVPAISSATTTPSNMAIFSKVGSSDMNANMDADRAFAFKQHNLAIKSLLACGDPSKALHVHLVSCLIFICIEALQGELLSAIRLFKHGLSMIEELNRRTGILGKVTPGPSSTDTAAGTAPGAPKPASAATPGSTASSSASTSSAATASTSASSSSTTSLPQTPQAVMPSPTAPSFSDSIVNAVVAFLNRFAVQVALLVGDIDPDLNIGVMAGVSRKPTLSPDTRFHSLLEARESILNLAIHVLSGAPRARLGDGFLESAVLMLGWWTAAFDQMVAERGPSLSPRGIALLELHKRYLAAHLKVPNPTNSDDRWMNYVTEFADIVSLAERALQPEPDAVGTKETTLPTFHMDLGVIPVMFSTVLRCRDPVVRRRALAVLRNNRLQEGIWDSSLTLRVAERIVMLEESSVAAAAVAAAGMARKPQRVKSIQVRMDPDEKVATLEYGLEDDKFEEVLDW